MTEKFEIFKCKNCTNVVEIINGGVGELVCCSSPMEKQDEHIAISDNPHYAIIEQDKDDPTFKKIYLNHEMKDEHYICLMEIISNSNKYLKRGYFKPGDKPELHLKCTCKEGFYIRVFCNKHGLWTTK